MNPLVRRIQKLEASAKSASGEGRPRLVIVRVGQRAEKAIAKLEDRRPDDFLMIVQLVAGQARGCSDQPRGKETFADSEAAASAV